MFLFILASLVSCIIAAPLYDGKFDTLAIGGYAGDRTPICLDLAAACRLTFDANLLNSAKQNPGVLTQVGESDACIIYVSRCRPDYDFVCRPPRLLVKQPSDEPTYKVRLDSKYYSNGGCSAARMILRGICVNYLRRSGIGLSDWRNLCNCPVGGDC